MLSIGFVLLTHSNQQQMLRLIRILNIMFDEPRIACHHDFSKEPLNRNIFPANVHFVEPYKVTKWGDISLVEGTIKAVRLLYAVNPPDWFYLISGSDYPVKRAQDIRHDLASALCDVFMTQHCTDHNVLPPKSAKNEAGFDTAHYKRLAYERYVGRHYPIPSWRHPHRAPAAGHLTLLSPALLRPFHPFNESFRCFSGDQWFVANSNAAECIIVRDLGPLLSYFKGRFPPDEAFFHTLFGNAKELSVCPELRHFVRWSRGNHPQFIQCEDLPAIQASKAHFARKFEPESPVLDIIDRDILRS